MFGHDTVKFRERKHHREHAGAGFRPGKIARETVFRVDAAKSVVANLAADGGIVGGGTTNHHLRL
jgi:hypothetical protein